jgi:hypothetical protein
MRIGYYKSSGILKNIETTLYPMILFNDVPLRQIEDDDPRQILQVITILNFVCQVIEFNKKSLLQCLLIDL